MPLETIKEMKISAGIEIQLGIGIGITMKTKEEISTEIGTGILTGIGITTVSIEIGPTEIGIATIIMGIETEITTIKILKGITTVTQIKYPMETIILKIITEIMDKIVTHNQISAKDKDQIILPEFSIRKPKSIQHNMIQIQTLN